MHGQVVSIDGDFARVRFRAANFPEAWLAARPQFTSIEADVPLDRLSTWRGRDRWHIAPGSNVNVLNAGGFTLHAAALAKFVDQLDALSTSAIETPVTNTDSDEIPLTSVEDELLTVPRSQLESIRAMLDEILR